MYPGRAAGAYRVVTGKSRAGIFTGGGRFAAAGKLASNAGRYSQPCFHRHHTANTVQAGSTTMEKNRLQNGGSPGAACWTGSTCIVFL